MSKHRSLTERLLQKASLGKVFPFFVAETKKLEILRVKNIYGLGWENQALAVGKPGIFTIFCPDSFCWGFFFHERAWQGGENLMAMQGKGRKRRFLHKICNGK